MPPDSNAGAKITAEPRLGKPVAIDDVSGQQRHAREDGAEFDPSSQVAADIFLIVY